MQAEREPKRPLLYSVQGFKYCDLFRAEAERATWARLLGLIHEARQSTFDTCCEVEQRAKQILAWDTLVGRLSDFGLHQLTLGRAHLDGAILHHTVLPIPHSRLELARRQLAAAVDGLRRAGEQRYVPRGLLTRAWLLAVESNAGLL